jgi:iron complex transport system substrate-binding protein
MRFDSFINRGLALSLIAGAALAVHAQNAVVLGGRAVVMVADAVYAFSSAPDRVVAVAGTDQGLGTFLGAVDPAFSRKPALDRTAGAESYAALKPDLVILKSAMKGSLGKGLEALGLRALYLDLETPEDYYRDLAALGRAFGEEQRAEALVAGYKRLVSDTERRVSGRPRPKVLLVQPASAAGVWEAPPEGWMQTSLVRMAGGDPVWAGAAPGGGWTRLGAEQIAAWNPDSVVVVSYREDAERPAAAFRTDPRFVSLAAVRNGRVLAMPQDFYSWDQPDTRWILGLRRIAAFLHPDRFADVDPGAEARAFFRDLYGIEGAAFDSIIAPRLKGAHGVR